MNLTLQLWSAACRLGAGGGRLRRPSSARIWTAPGTWAFIIRVSLRGKNDALGTPLRIVMSDLLDGGTQRYPRSAADVNPRSAA